MDGSAGSRDEAGAGGRTWSPSQTAFLAAFGVCGIVKVACEAAEVGRATVYVWRKDADFAAAMDSAGEDATDLLEREALRRATEGTVRPVYYKGEECGGVREYSDTLTALLLKARRPDKYRENQKIEHSGPGGGAIPIDVRDATERIMQCQEAYEAALKAQAALVAAPQTPAITPTVPATDDRPQP